MTKIALGKVVSTKMQGTAVVEVTRMVPHPLYKKLLKRSKKFKADTNGQQVAVGSEVKIQETLPLSKDKHFKIIEVKNKKQKK